MGKQEARAVDDFLWEMEQYLKGVNMVDDASKIKMATRYLKDTEALWWRRRRLRKLKQSGTIQEYVKEFTTLVLKIPELSDQDSLFYFLDGLQGWAKTELERHGVQDLSTAIAHAEALIDFSKPPTRKDKNLKTSYKSGGCFICDGPHRAQDCPKKASLNGLSAHDDEDASDGESMGSIRILNAIKAKTEVPKVVG
ncbi:putative retrotransposon gag domain, aspartic peptidase domain protein, partial [Tanacetum coccineum]